MSSSQIITGDKVVFEILPNGVKSPIYSKFVKSHMVFDIKMEDSRKKNRVGGRWPHD